jgi:hypothetical protein
MLCNENVIYSNGLSSLFFTTKNVKFAIYHKSENLKKKEKGYEKSSAYMKNFEALEHKQS